MFIVELQDQPHREHMEFICSNATEVQRVLACEYQALILEEYKVEFSKVRPQWRQLICEPNVAHLFSANGIIYSVSPYKPGKRAMVIDANEMMKEHYGLDAFDRVVNRFHSRLSQ